MAAAKAVISRVRAVRTSKRAYKSSPASSQNLMERMPSEVLIKILSYLDAGALFSMSYVNKFFNQLANDNALWSDIFIREFGKNKKWMPKSVDDLSTKDSTMEVQEKAAGYWKQQYFKTVAAYVMKKWKRHLGVISRHTGLPSQTERVLRNLCVTWELTVSDESGHDSTFEQSWSQFSETCVFLCWGGGCLPNYQQISTLQLHGVRRIALNCSSLNKPGWRSLMMNLDMDAVTKNAQVIGQDRLVQLILLQPGVTVGVWEDQDSVAFVMFTLHFHRLVEKSIQGSSVCSYVEPLVKPPFDDIDPEYGLHGYHLHITLHNISCEIMSRSFSQLFCRRAQICDGLIQLTAISRTNLSQHTPLSGRITLPWRCEALQGTVENCCIMSLTLLDEFEKPFWCVSSPVSMKIEKSDVSYDYDSEQFLIHYKDTDGQVKMDVVHMKEQRQFVLINLDVYVATCKVNNHFGRNY
ncbi:F-box only protein 15 [Sphaeramia orbicularis]|uniref:F-box only protein 15 n=1 Tax=Sphaeramia orbicularis TaxID=375764 RepID=UPI001180C492|nr:F-box only protein 15 [Sphaeramia orbicularis]